MEILDIITSLSHEFGTGDYVCGGGGNTSCKNETTLWVKPSGTTLIGLTPDTFVAIDRTKLAELYDIEPPEVPAEREQLVKEVMASAILPESPGRASVEAPLHDSLSARYVVHTHPYIVNGMTSAKEGKTVCKKLFPSALWIDYIDPGYTLCMEVRKEIVRYRECNGFEPKLIFLKNHGVFVSADTPEEIRELYALVMNTLRAEYKKAALETVLECSPPVDQASLSADCTAIRQAMKDDSLFIATSGAFEVSCGPISPDHMVYAKAYPYIGAPTVEGLRAFTEEHGYAPQVLVFNQSVFGVADTEKGAYLALLLAKDAAMIEKLAKIFGGIDYMSDGAREFIQNWEVESYRKKQLA
ncbi:MAG: class II aldolase/adducin family protein [Kiritimatiellae bacterium]|nr:class II aldolase/adducin family protein [Kiritimatiellia bacterium]